MRRTALRCCSFIAAQVLAVFWAWCALGAYFWIAPADSDFSFVTAENEFSGCGVLFAASLLALPTLAGMFGEGRVAAAASAALLTVTMAASWWLYPTLESAWQSPFRLSAQLALVGVAVIGVFIVPNFRSRAQGQVEQGPRQFVA